MCWMTIRREHDALARGICETREHENANGHSWGYAYVSDGDLVVEKGVGTIPDDAMYIPPVDNAIVHTRFATTGEVNKTNAHPFKIVYDGDTVAALAHNGTWYGAPDSEKYSDTWMMARLFEQNLRARDGDFERALIDTVSETGETCVILRRDGTGYVYSGRFTITRDNSVVSSSGYDEIPQGLYRLDTNGEVTEVEQTAVKTYSNQ